MIYLLIIILLSIFVCIYDLHNNTNGKKICYWGMCILLICIAGFRYRLGIDTIAYMHIFDYETPYLMDFLTTYKRDELPFEFASSLLFSLGKTMSDSWYVTQFLIAFLTNLSIFIFGNKNTPYKFTFILLYFVLLYFDLSFETLRQACALSFALWGCKFLKDKAYVPYYILALVAFLFHPVAIILFFIPFIQVKFNLMLAVGLSLICLVFSLFFNIFFSDLNIIFEFLGMDSLQAKVMSYTESEALGTESLNITGRNWKFYAEQLLVYLIPIYFICYLSKSLIDTTENKYLSPFIYIWILSVSLQSAIPIMYRLKEFVLPICLIVFAEALITAIASQSIHKKIIITYSIAVMLFYGSYAKFFRVVDNGQHTYPRIVSYFPYANCFTQDTDDQREYYYNEAGR